MKVSHYQGQKSLPGSKSCSAELHRLIQSLLSIHPGRFAPSAPLFSSARGGTLSTKPLSQSDVFRMIQRYAQGIQLEQKINCHSFRATGITHFLERGGRIEDAARMAAQTSIQTTLLYDRRERQPI